MKILVINCGSSSIKYQLFDINDEYQLLAKGLVERIGLSGSKIKHTPIGSKAVEIVVDLPDHEAAMIAVEKALTSPAHGVIKDVSEIEGVGHRVVHGGESFTGSTLIDDNVLKAINENSKLAPLHNPPNIIGIETCRRLMGTTPNVAVFDTAVHQTMPKKAYLYALPIDLYKKHAIRKYGFHGTSHGYVARQAAEVMGKPFEEAKIITCHVGNGGSITAFDKGKSVDTSMGLTPLEGIVMGTRSGDIDPAIVLYLQEMLGMSLKETNDMLNKESGLKGLTGKADMRDVLVLADEGNEEAKTAIEIFCYRIVKYIGSYAAALNGVDGIVFTAGVGENNAFLREHILEYFGYLGLKIDKEKNNNHEQVFSTPDSKVVAMMIPTNEELVIAQDTFNIIKSK